jgi:hypothetical protein
VNYVERCEMSDLPVDQCALPCHLGVALPAGVAPEVTRGDVSVGFPVWPPQDAREQREPRDTRTRARRPKPLESCRWDGALESWVTPEHVRDCDDGGCRGCKPCGKTHCAMRGSCPNHVDSEAGIRTCPQCIGAFRNDVTEVETLAALVGDELIYLDTVEHAVSGPEAPIWTHRDITDIANLAGPVADPEQLDTRRTFTQTVDATRGFCQWPRDEDVYGRPDARHPAAVLGRWEYLFRRHYGHAEPRQETAVWPRARTTARSTVSSAADYLRALLDGPMPHEDVFEQVAREIAAVKTHLEDALSDSRKPETGAPCPTCGVQFGLEAAVGGEKRKPPRLEKRYAHWCDDEKCEREHDASGSKDRWVCPINPLHEFTEAEYRLRIGNEYLARAAALTAGDMQRQWGIAPSTLRTWAERGQVHRRGKDGNGRMLYDVAEARACEQARTEKLETAGA